jgi:ketosteroid isomerase-like protein
MLTRDAMDVLVRPGTAAAFGLLVLAAPHSAHTQSSVRQTLERFLVPFSSRDVPAFMEFFADGATAFFPPSPRAAAKRVEGKAAIAAAFKALFDGFPAARSGGSIIEPQDLHVEEFESVAIASFHLGNDTTRGRRTFVLRRVGAEWKIVHLHASTFQTQ